jgi:hydroxymethylbilane synthase
VSAGTLRFGTRTSALARWQTEHVAAELRAHWPSLDVDIHPYHTFGDTRLDVPLPLLGGKGAFTAELERGLRDGHIDVAVHSLKDLPVEPTPGLAIGAILPRADARDVIVSQQGAPLDALPPGARIGTSSLRRHAQLARRRPDLAIVSIRGNVDTRLHKVRDGAYDAIVLAAAGMERLGLAHEVTEYLSFDIMLPAPGQGALAVQCRADDQRVLTLLQRIDDAPTRAAVEVERTFLHALGAGCSAPVAALATHNTSGHLTVRGLVATPDGRDVIEVRGGGSDPSVVGADLARDAMARGAEAILRSAPTPHEADTAV